MEAVELFSTLVKEGFSLERKGDGLAVVGPLTDEWQKLIRANKADLCEVLNLRQAAGPDWDSISENPAALAAWANLRRDMQLRDHGQVPEHWTKEFDCPRCATVPVEPSWPNHVDHCPWCFNRVSGKPMPVIYHL